MKSKALLVLFSALMTLAMALTDTKAADLPVGDSDAVNNMTEKATIWSPELVGGQWGWRLTKYRYIDQAYKINGQTLLLLSTDINNTDNVLWNPLTGTGRHLDHGEYKRFWYERKNDMLLHNLFPVWAAPSSNDKVIPGLYQVKLFAGRKIQLFGSPGQYFNCGSIFYSYYGVYDKSSRLIKTFYVLEKLEHPKDFKYFVCPEAETKQEKHIKIKFEETKDIFFTELFDETLLFFSIETKNTVIVRLDQNLQQHTSMGGRMFVLDAAKINSILLSEQIKSENNAQFRYDLFMKEIASVQNSGMP